MLKVCLAEEHQKATQETRTMGLLATTQTNQTQGPIGATSAEADSELKTSILAKTLASRPARINGRRMHLIEQ